jgi:hypothetical protein
MISGNELRELRRAAGLGLGTMAARCWYSKSYLGLVETGRKPVTGDVVSAYSRVMGVGLDDDPVDRRDFLTATAVAAANAVLIGDLSGSLAGGDAAPLATVQTSYAVDHAIAATMSDYSSLRRLRTWAEGEASPIVRVNATGILAKMPGQTAADHVVTVLEHDAAVRDRYLTAVVARLCGVDHPSAARHIDSPGQFGQPQLLAQRLVAEAVNPDDAGARWCSATLLARLSPHLGRQ